MTRSLSEDLITFDQRAERYAKYVREVDKRRFTTGLYGVDRLIRGVAPGEVMTIIAYSGTYKSAYLQNLLHQFARRSGLFQIFFSMEMPTEKVFEREMQIAYETSGHEVETAYKEFGDTVASMMKAATANGSAKVLVCERTRLTIDEITRFVHLAEVKHGDVGSIGIDYLGLMRSEGKTIFEKMSELSFSLKDMAKRLSLPVIVLGQVNRAYASSKGVEIEMDAAKGGGDIEAGADYMLGLMMTEDEELILKVLKNRNGPKNKYFRIDLNPRTLTISGAEEWEPPKKAKGKKDDCPF